jgi:hypothetical protein
MPVNIHDRALEKGAQKGGIDTAKKYLYSVPRSGIIRYSTYRMIPNTPLE